MSDPPAVTIKQYDTIEFVNGTPGCVECGALLCIESREGPANLSRTIENAMLPNPVDDIVTIQCAGCGTPLWHRDGQ